VSILDGYSDGTIALRDMIASPAVGSDILISQPDLFPPAESRSSDQPTERGVVSGRDSSGPRPLVFDGWIDYRSHPGEAMGKRAAVTEAFAEGETTEVLTFRMGGEDWAYFGRPRGAKFDLDAESDWQWSGDFLSTDPSVYGEEVHLEGVTSETIDPVGVRDSSAYRFVIPPCTSPQIGVTALDSLAGLSQVQVSFPGLVVPASHTLVVDGMGVQWGTPCAYIDGPGGKTYVTEQAVEVGTGKLGRILPFTHLGCTFQFTATGATECDVFYRACFG
jgi:hypothetical protein